MPVRLLDCTQNPDMKVAAAALTSITGKPSSDIYFHLKEEGLWEEDTRKLKEVLNSGHLDILEHAVFTFSLEDISRMASFTLVRHRIPTFTQSSQRYSPVNRRSIYTPASIQKNGRANEIFSDFVHETFEFYTDAIEEGFLREDARYGLCLATKTNLLFGVNLRELLHIISSNTEFVPEEISNLSIEMLSVLKERAPICSLLLEGLKDDGTFGEYADLQSLRKANRMRSKKFFMKNDEIGKSIDVKGKNDGVVILECTKNPVMAIAKSLSGFYSGCPAKKISAKDAGKIIESLKEAEFAPREFEYADVTFNYDESLASAHQDIRHRMRTMTIQPIFSVIEKCEAVIPPSFKNTGFEERIGRLVKHSRRTYDSLGENGIPLQDACYVALNCAKANVTSRFDFRNLLKAMSLRCCLRAQWEIRGIYDGILREMTRIAPEIFGDGGPGCRRKSGCPEGNLICETPRGKYFPHEIYMKKYPESRLAQKLKEIKA